MDRIAYHFAQLLADKRAVHVVVVSPSLVAGVVWRINIDALHLSGVIWQQRLERDKVVTLHNQIALTRIAAGKFGYILEQNEKALAGDDSPRPLFQSSSASASCVLNSLVNGSNNAIAVIPAKAGIQTSDNISTQWEHPQYGFVRCT